MWDAARGCMQEALQITFRDVPSSPSIEKRIRDRAAKLERFADRITSCRVVVGTPHRHQRKGYAYDVRIDLTLPGQEIVVNREATDSDLYVAIREAFEAVGRQIEHRIHRD
jgi:ribosomal subunit interface protein